MNMITSTGEILPSSTTELTEHEAFVQELFIKSSVPLPGHNTLRVIDIENFTTAIDIMMQKAYLYGAQESLSRCETIIDDTFK